MAEKRQKEVFIRDGRVSNNVSFEQNILPLTEVSTETDPVSPVLFSKDILFCNEVSHSVGVRLHIKIL